MSLCAESGGYRSYFEAYLRRDRQKKADMVFVEKGALRAERRMVDRGAYTDFLEDQLEKVSQAVLKAEDQQLRFDEFLQRLDQLETLSHRLDVLEGRVQALGEPPSLAPLELRIDKAEKATSQLASSSLRHADARNKVVVDAIALLEAKLDETIDKQEKYFRRARQKKATPTHPSDAPSYPNSNTPPPPPRSATRHSTKRPPPPPQESPNDVFRQRDATLRERRDYEEDDESLDEEERPLSRSQLDDPNSSSFREMNNEEISSAPPRRSSANNARTDPARDGEQRSVATGNRLDNRGATSTDKRGVRRSTRESEYDDYYEEDEEEEFASGRLSTRVSQQLAGLRKESTRSTRAEPIVYEEEEEETIRGGARSRRSSRVSQQQQQQQLYSSEKRRKGSVVRSSRVNDPAHEVDEVRHPKSRVSSSSQRQPAARPSVRREDERVSSTSSHLYLPKERRKSVGGPRVPKLRLDEVKREEQERGRKANLAVSTKKGLRQSGGFRRDEYIGYRWPDSVTHCGPLPKQRQPWVPAVKVGTPRGT